MSCHDGYDHPCGKRCIFPKCHNLRHLSDPGDDNMMIDKNMWDDLLADDISDSKVQQKILNKLRLFNSPTVTKQLTMRMNIWDNPLYDHFIIALCQLIEKQKGNGYNLLLLKSPLELQQNRTLLWTLLA